MNKTLLHILALGFVLIRIFGAATRTIRPRLSILNEKHVSYTKYEDPLTPDFKIYNYTQTLDHFNYKPESYTTFQQRYVMNSKFWAGANTSSPIFLYMGAEIDVVNLVGGSGFFKDLASRFNGLLVYIEHRYYGTSMPFGSEEEAYKDANSLGFFSSEQALADYAQLILSLKQNLSAESCPVIAVGGSYGGMLAAWFRLKYPHITYGAFASSSPLLYFEGLTPENGYDAVVSNDFNTTSESCYKAIRESWFEIDRVADQPNGLSSLSQTFNTCSPLNTTHELKDYLEDKYDRMAQYNYYDSLQTFCDACDAIGNETSVLNKIMAGYKAVFGSSCNDVVYDGLSKDYGWGWQSCTEMVMPFGRGENDTMFQANPFDLANYTNECEKVFGVTPRPYWAPIEFGGHGIKSVLSKFASNIIFSNGLRDPYSAGGVLENISDTILAINTKEGHHCWDLQTPMVGDPEWLIAQRMKEIKVIEEWLFSKANRVGGRNIYSVYSLHFVTNYS